MILKQSKSQNGFILISVLISTLFVMVAGAATAGLAANNYRASSLEQYRVGAQFAADAGIDAAIQEVNLDFDWTGTAGEVELLNNGRQKTTYDSTMVQDASDPLLKHLTVTGRTYVPADNPTPRVQRTYEVDVRAVSGGSSSVVSGVGGLVMENNSKVLGGNLSVNGTITMYNSAQIGMASKPIDVKVAHFSCPVPADSTYPKQCGTGDAGEPIEVNHPAHIYGEVLATNQTDGSRMTDPGLIANSTATPEALPDHDRAAVTAAISETRTGAAASCNNGNQTWPANLKIDGDVTLSGKCSVTVYGDVWITGELRMSNQAELKVADSAIDAPVIMIDGQDGLFMTQSSKLTSNAALKGFRIITYWSRAACSPDCPDVSGVDLFNSRNDVTIRLQNNTEGPNTEFYARWTKVSIENFGNIGALVGQTIHLSNSATVTFGAEVTGSLKIAGWVIESYKRSF